MTTLRADARKGDIKMEINTADVCRVGEIVVIDGQEARTILAKGRKR